MIASEKTLYLENLLTKYREKEKKNYLTWESVRKDLGQVGRKKFGLTAKSLMPEVKIALDAFLGDSLMFADKDGVLCLAEKMSQEEWKRGLIAKENAILKKILLQHKEKTNENCLTWEQLLGNLSENELKIFSLTAKNKKPAWTKLKPFLGNNLDILENSGICYIAFVGMTQDDLRHKIAFEKERNLENVIKKIFARYKSAIDLHKASKNKSYMQLKLSNADLKTLGLTAKSSMTEIKKILAPFLGSSLVLLTKEPKTARGKETLYLSYNLPFEEFIKESIQSQSQKKTFTLKAIADDVPIDKAEFVALFNRMLETGQLQVTIDAKLAIVGAKVVSGSTPVPHRSPTGTNDGQLFKDAFDKLDRGRIYVRICNMRRELGWSTERFDAELCRLRSEGIIQLHAGDSSPMTEEDVNLSYIDRNNFSYTTMTWKKR